MGKKWFILVTVLVVSVAACEALRSSPDMAPTEEVEQSAQEVAEEIVDSVQSIRNREFPEPLEIAGGEPKKDEFARPPDSVQEEWQWLSPILFGGEKLELIVDDRRVVERAGYDDDAQRLVYAGDPGQEPLTAFAVSMAANRALEKMVFGGHSEVESVDQWLSREITRRAGPAFASAVLMAERSDLDLTIDDLSERPEFLAHVPGLDDLIKPVEFDADMLAELESPRDTQYFEEALQQLVLRKALSMGAALYRAGGWPGVEWGHGEPPIRTDQIVRIDKWFAGDGPAQWQWPEAIEDERIESGWKMERQGRVGPAMTALWLEGLVGTQAARTIYGGWLADSYRIYTDDDDVAFYWVSAWDTPHAAQEIAAAAEAVLAHFVGSEHRQSRFRVAVQGITVAVVIYDTDREADELDGEVELLTEVRAGFLTQETAPFEFVPTLYERYVATTEEATLNLEQWAWTDPASGWVADLSSLERWNLQRSDEAHVRWFATHSDGSMIQWTTELVNPLGPAFGSSEYLARLSEAFGETVSAREDPSIRVTDEPVEPTVQLEVMGLIDGVPTVLHLWQWRRGDVLVTFSLQGGEDGFGDRFVEAEAVLDTLEPHGTAVEQSETEEIDPADDEGIIEFSVED